MNFIIYNQ